MFKQITTFKPWVGRKYSPAAFVLSAARREQATRLVRAALVEKKDDANSKHAAALVLRSARLQSVANWVRAQLGERLDALEQDLVECLRANDPTVQGTDNLFTDAQQRVERAFGASADWTERTFKELAAALAKSTAAHKVKHRGGDAEVAAGKLVPVLGLTLKEHFEKLASDCLVRFKAQVRQGLANGEDLAGLIERVVGSDGQPVAASEPVKAALSDAAARTALEVALRLLDTSGNSIDKVIQAAVMAFANEAETQAGDTSGGDGEEPEQQQKLGWQWVAVMDAATCPQCEYLDGSRWNADYEPVDEGPDYPSDGVPLHFGCRCSLVPSDLSEPAAEMDFDEYLSQFSRSEQEEAFGKSTLRAYRRGDITAAALAGQKSNMMTLERFKEVEK